MFFSYSYDGSRGVDYGNIGVMATFKLNFDMVINNGYRSKFSHKSETAIPGMMQ